MRRSQVPMIAVLPLENMSGHPEHEPLAAGLTEDLVTGLSGYGWIPVIDRGSAAAVARRGGSAKEIGEALGARYLVVGAVRIGEERLVIDVRLVDVESGTHLWSKRYAGALSEVFRFEDEIAQSIAGSLSPALLAIESRRALRRKEPDLVAWERVMRAMWHFREWDRHGHDRARELCTEAMALDPHFPLPHALMAHIETQAIAWEFASDVGAAAENGLKCARRAVELDPLNPDALNSLGWALIFRRDYAAAIDVLERAIELNPSHVKAHHALGSALELSDRAAEALPHFDRAIRLSPHDPDLQTILGFRANALYRLERWEECEASVERAVAADPRIGFYVTAAAACAKRGDLERGREWVRRWRANHPEFTMNRLRLFIPEEFVVEVEAGLRVLGFDGEGRPVGSGSARFQRGGAFWQLEFEGDPAQIRDLKGLRFLAELLRRPGAEVHAMDLIAAIEGRPTGTFEEPSRIARDLGDAGPLLDAEARRAYVDRVRELDGELAEAERFADLARATRIRAEIDQVRAQLAAAYGLGGRARRAGAHAERARTLVTQRIRTALQHIQTAHPALAVHLNRAVHTGYFCVYRPEEAERVRWQL